MARTSERNVGAPELFNVLKPAFLSLFEWQDLSRRDMEGLVGQLLQPRCAHREFEERILT